MVAIVEVARALATRDEGQASELRRVMRGISLIAFDRAVAERAAAVEPQALRTLDAVHLASALELGSDLEGFVTYDGRLAAAARAQGLHVEAPGAS